MDTPADPPAGAAAEDHDGERSYDIFFTTSAKWFILRFRNRGVTLHPDRIAWTFNGAPDSVPYANIKEVRLQSGGDWRSAINMCEIVFADGYKLIVNNGSASGLADDEQRPRYRDFVRDLLARLSRRQGIAFNAGYPERKHRILMACAAVMALIFVVLPIVLLLFAQDMKTLGLLFGAVFLYWPFWRMISNNAPRSFDPASPPHELLE